MPSVRLGVHGRRVVFWLGIGVVVAASFAGRASAGLTFVVTTTADSGPGSLRQAISDANANAGLDTIAFAIPGAGVHTIRPLTALPVVTDPVVIDGRTQPGWEFPGPPVVQLLGPGKDPATFDYLIGAGIEIDGGGSVVEGLAVGGFGIGINLESNGDNVIQFDVVGADPAGTTAVPNGFGVLVDNSDGNVIGGAFLGGDLVSGNDGDGIRIENSNDNAVIGSLVGVASTGSAALPNGTNGVIVLGPCHHTVIGGPLGARNVISGNESFGIRLYLGGVTDTVVDGNYVGTTSDGQAPLGNFTGIGLEAASANAISNNLVSGNADFGVEIGGPEENNSPSVGNTLSGNLVGTTANGMAALPNGSSGVDIVGSSHNVIGPDGQTAGPNVISGNGADGVEIDTPVGIANVESDGNLIVGNVIGRTSDAKAPLGNGVNGVGSGVLIERASSSNVVEDNQIADNTGAGVTVLAGDGNTIIANSIFDNQALGIDLNGDGVTLNDCCGHVGPNHFQNFPVLTSVKQVGNKVSVSGGLDSTPSSSFRIDLFTNGVCDPSGYGQGFDFLGYTTVTTDALGNATFTARLKHRKVPLAKTIITATATNSALGDTSEFSACQQ